MPKSCHLRYIALLILSDFVIASLLYLTGPALTSLYMTDFFSAKSISLSSFFYYFSYLIIFWKRKLIGGAVLGAMFLTTLIPTFFHLFISFLFFGSKIIAQPLRVCVERTIGHMIKRPRGVTTFFTLIGAITIYVFAWIIDKLV